MKTITTTCDACGVAISDDKNNEALRTFRVPLLNNIDLTYVLFDIEPRRGDVDICSDCLIAMFNAAATKPNPDEASPHHL